MVDASGTTTYAYDKVGNLQSFAYPNGVATTYNYDTLNRLTQMGSSALGHAGCELRVQAYARLLDLQERERILTLPASARVSASQNV